MRRGSHFWWVWVGGGGGDVVVQQGFPLQSRGPDALGLLQAHKKRAPKARNQKKLR